MNILRIILVILLPLAATWLTFKKRHLMLVHPVRSSLRQRGMGFGLVLMLMFSMAPAWYEYAMGPWGRYYWYDRSGFFIIAAFIAELLIYRHLAEAWKRSLPFKGGMQVPICGCILTILIWLHDREQRRKYLQAAGAPPTKGGPGSMRMVILRRRRRLAAGVALVAQSGTLLYRRLATGLAHMVTVTLCKSDPA